MVALRFVPMEIDIEGWPQYSTVEKCGTFKRLLVLGESIPRNGSVPPCGSELSLCGLDWGP